MIKLIDLVPSSIRNDPQVQAACEAIDQEIAAIYTDIPPVGFWANLDKQTSPLLDVLMWEYHVDWTQILVTGEPLTDQLKREAIDKSIVWHQKKGTKWAVEQILRTSWPTASVAEWYQYGGRPYYFRVLVDEDIAGDLELFARVVQAVMVTKNVRSWLDEEGFLRPFFIFGGFFVGGFAITRDKILVPSYGEDRLPIPPMILVRIIPATAIVDPVPIHFEVQNSTGNFKPTAKIAFNGIIHEDTKWFDASTLYIENLDLTTLGGPGLVEVRVVDGTDYSNTLIFDLRDAVEAPLTLIYSIPDEAEEDTFIDIDCFGTGFTPSTEIIFDGVVLPTVYHNQTFVESEHFALSITALDPSSSLPDQVITLIIYGKSFSQNSRVFFGGKDVSTAGIYGVDDRYLDLDTGNVWVFSDSGGRGERWFSGYGDPTAGVGGITVTFISETELRVVGLDVGSQGTKQVQVREGNRASNIETFTVSEPAVVLPPTIISISPSRQPTDQLAGQPFLLTVRGHNFNQGSTILWNGNPVTTTIVNFTELQAMVIVPVGTVNQINVQVRQDSDLSNIVAFILPLATFVGLISNFRNFITWSSGSFPNQSWVGHTMICTTPGALQSNTVITSVVPFQAPQITFTPNALIPLLGGTFQIY